MTKKTPETLASLIDYRLSRRGMLKGGIMLGAATLLPAPLLAETALSSSLAFKEIAHGYDERHHIAEGYNAEILLRWGDGVLKDAPGFDPFNQTPEAQEQQFGANCDFIAYLPLPYGSKDSTHGLLCVNHESTKAYLMFPKQTFTKQQAETEMAAHGHSVVEVAKKGNRWETVKGSTYNRRISGLSTEFLITGPAAGNPRMKTSADPAGTKILGTLGNCSGGVTPWGTVLFVEENFDNYLVGKAEEGSALAKDYKRFDIQETASHTWYKTHNRFDLSKEPNEYHRFGWVIEYDPYDPQSVPAKRTALGRCKHETATVTLAGDGRVVVYSGDDQEFEYLYKFVSSKAYDPANRAANKNLLDDGVLYAAKFKKDGSLAWRPLVYGQGKLTEANGFASQGDVVIDVRRAAELVGATPLDRPEGIAIHPHAKKIYVALTNNKDRGVTDVANPRTKNRHGHILELATSDHGASTMRWDIFIMAGNPGNAADNASYPQAVSNNGWFSCPDNLATDPQGRLWVATDGMWESSQVADGLYAVDTAGKGRGLSKHFFDAPKGGEITGPCFTPDGKTLFISVQHPGHDDPGSSFSMPSTRWPDFDPAMPPRSAVVAVTKEDGGGIGG